MHMLTTTWCTVVASPKATAWPTISSKRQGRVYSAIKRIVEASPYLVREAVITQNRISFPSTGAVIQAVGSDYAGAAGANPTISCFDELWAYTSERIAALVG